MTVYRSGPASIEIKDGALLASLDRVSEGAASSFIRRATSLLEGVKTGAMARWPVRSGKSRAGFSIASRLTEKEIRVSLYNSQPYAYKIRWSVRTSESIEAEIDKAAARGVSSETQAKIRKRFSRKLYAIHGKGAPDATVAGKSPWVLYVRRPSISALSAAMPDLQADLNKLAQGVR